MLVAALPRYSHKNSDLTRHRLWRMLDIAAAWKRFQNLSHPPILLGASPPMRTKQGSGGGLLPNFRMTKNIVIAVKRDHQQLRQ